MRSTTTRIPATTNGNTSVRKSTQRWVQAIQDGVQRLSPVDVQLLQALLRYPFLRAEDVAVARAIHVATVYRHLALLHSSGLIERVIPGVLGTGTCSLYHLSNLGLHVLAAYEQEGAETLARFWHTDERGLLHLLPRLASLVTLDNCINALVAHAPEALAQRGRQPECRWVLAPFRAQPNAPGLWDTHHLGYYAALTFPGKTIAHPGTPVLSKKTKQGGQQEHLLEAFEVASTLTDGTYTGMVMAMEQVAVNKALYTTGHGYLDQETADWKPLVLQTGDNAGEAEDWVTTEAMGIALEALQSLPVPASNDSSTPTVLPTVGG